VLVPKAEIIDVLMNPKSANAWPDLNETRVAAQTLGFRTRRPRSQQRARHRRCFRKLRPFTERALFLLADGFFRNQSEQLIKLAARYAVSVSYPWVEFAEAGGLICYGANNPDAWRQGGVYIGRILKGAKAADLPVIQSTKLELAINRKTAKMLGLEIPTTLLALADEVID
jgi:putative tryptophan/tyrosine transport system substrate-binding protein